MGFKELQNKKPCGEHTSYITEKGGQDYELQRKQMY